MTPRAFPKLYCAAGIRVTNDAPAIELYGRLCWPMVIGDGLKEPVTSDDAMDNWPLHTLASFGRNRIPKGAWEIAFEVDE